MSITVTAAYAQANLLQLLNLLDDGTHDKVIVQDGGVNLCQLATWSVYQAADPANSAGVTTDVASAYAISPSVQGKAFYRFVKRMRDRQAQPDALTASGTITCVAKASLIDNTDTITLTNAAGVGTTFAFDVDGGGVPSGTPVNISGDTTADDVAATLAGVIDGTTGFAAVAVGAVVTVTQSDPGATGNYAIVENVVNGSFTVTGFINGADATVAGGVIGLKNSKNDAAPRAAIIPEDHAVAIDL